MSGHEGGNVTDAKPVTSNGEQRNAGHRFHSSHELATSYAAVNVIDPPREEKARMSPHGIPPTRGWDNPILLSPSHKSTSVECVRGTHDASALQWVAQMVW